MNAKRTLVAGILALEMSASLAGCAASAPRPAPDSETTVRDASVLLVPPRRELREWRVRCMSVHSRGYEEALRVKDLGGSGRDVFRAYEDAVCRDPDTDLVVLCLNAFIGQANKLAIQGGSGAQVLDLIERAESECN
ncbi:hypothetical protein [Polyangium aurulentum]|uniref:hypothetical protein n=1 Tax=Polyangium aurulentum TaxID=2567896 RepID=UPI0010ADC89B|nr:hypothetical protein [Polyangium aurulentum]UQA54810.1 hypothetical protein E8A73_025930 [Polyangium aurulentum]